jgi:hypothetical protein
MYYDYHEYQRVIFIIFRRENSICSFFARFFINYLWRLLRLEVVFTDAPLIDDSLRAEKLEKELFYKFRVNSTR